MITKMINLLTLLFKWSRSIHRVFLFAASFLFLAMGGTGILMKYYGLNDVFGTDPLMVRYIHNVISTYMSGAFFIMMLTGLYMYFFPSFLRLFSKRQDQSISQ